MSDTSVVPPVVVAAPVVASVPTPPKPKRFKLHDEWHWILSHSWSIRFVFLAFILSGLEVFMPLFVDSTTIPRMTYAIAMAIVTGAAFVARLIAQSRVGVDGE